MIQIKATKAKESAVSSYATYALEEPGKASRGPMLLALFLTGLAVYIKSVFPTWGSLGPQPLEAEPNVANHLADPEPSLTPTVEDIAFQDPETPLPDGNDEFRIVLAGSSDGTIVQLQSSPIFGFTAFPELDLIPLPDLSIHRTTGVGSGAFHDAANDNAWSSAGGGSPPANSSSSDGGGSPPPNSSSSDGGGSPPANSSTSDGGGNAPANSSSSPGGGSSSVDSGNDGGEPDKEDDVEVEKPLPNRAPRLKGPVYLYDVTGCAAVLFGLSDLLRNASDPDGDALTISDLSVSSGTMTYTPQGWLYDPSALGPVVVTYQISDGHTTVLQHAYFSVVKNPPIIGTAGDDALLGGECADDIDGAAGDDNIDARGGNDTVNGGDGDDHVVLGSGNDVIFAGRGNDVVFGGDGNDWISGGAGNDRLFGDAGKDTIFGDEGDDLVVGGLDDDLLFGGTGDDRLEGGDGADILDGEDGADDLAGGNGNDILLGHAGEDLLRGGDGNDFLAGGEGGDSVFGGSGNDIVSGDIDGAVDTYDGGTGMDTLDYSAASLSIEADLGAEYAASTEIGQDRVAGFETIKTGGGNDTIRGSNVDDTIESGHGDDQLFDGHGADHVDGGGGNDVVFAALDAADDTYSGGEGFDTLDYSTSLSAVMVDFASGTATGIEIGTDTISEFEAAVGGFGNDHFVVASAPVSLRGGDGDDVFEFHAASGDSHASAVVHEILDFMIGDRIKISRYEMFEEVIDSLENRFEDIYGDNSDEAELPIRVRHQSTDEIWQTYVDADLDKDGHYELNITLDGHHVLMIVENTQTA